MKKFIALIAVVVLGVIVWFGILPDKESALPEGEIAIKPWIEVESVRVVRVDEAGAELTPLGTGDSVEPGTIIRTDAGGRATVYFPDGSNLRIDPDTTLVISESEFDDSTGTLKVRVFLTLGRVWSKIVALATPESHWEVRTGTAVATVRGSAFGTEVNENGEASIIGSEHDVFVTPIDEETGRELIEAQVTVRETEVLAMRREIVEEIKRLAPEERKEKAVGILARQLRGNDHPLRSWIESNEKRDSFLGNRVRELQNNGLEGRELRGEIREFLREEFRQRMEQEAGQVTENARLPVETIKQQPTEDKPNAASLEIVERVPAEGAVSEGTILEFAAVVIFSDGTRKPVTDLVDWQVVGSIGRMQKPGVFEAALGTDVSEIGTAFGAVTVRYKAEMGKEFFAKSGVITVIGKKDVAEERG